MASDSASRSADSRRRLPWPALAVLAGAAAAGLATAAAAPALAPAAGLTVATIGLWATGALPESITALGFFLLAMLLGVAGPDVVFSGFAAAAVWLVFGGLVLARAVTRTGLGAWLAGWLTARLPRSYPGLIAGIVALAGGLGFVLPSTMGRVALLTPIVLALADRLGFPPGSKGRTGMALAAILGTYVICAAILPANVANMVLAGAAETVHGIQLRYGPYLFLHFPVLGVLKGLALIAVVCWLFADRPAGAADTDPPAPPGPEARRLALLLTATLALWATDFLHGISPAWIGLGAAWVCLLPGVALVPADELGSRVNLTPLFYVAAILGVAAVINASGLGEALAGGLVAWLPLAPGADAVNYASLVGLGTGLGLATAVPGIPAVLTPLAGDLAAATGWPVETVLMTQVVAFSTIVLPYELPPLVVGMALAGVRLRDGARLTLTLAAITLLVLVPLNYGWWRLTGWLG